MKAKPARSPRPAAEAAPKPTEKAVPKTPPKPVLLIDRDPFSRVIFSQYLRSKGFKVVVAANEDEAYGVTRKHGKRWYALISDLNSMNLASADEALWKRLQADGIEFKRRILLAAPHPAEPAVRATLRKHPAKLLRKPVPPQTLSKALGYKAPPPPREEY